MQAEQALSRVERLAQGGKMVRLLSNPLRYGYAMWIRYVWYPYRRQPVPATAHTFFGDDMRVLLPAGTDLYLTGGKTHGSELRLARFMLRYVQTGDTVVDIGAHFGFFGMLAARLVGLQGRVLCWEASPATFKVLHYNVAALPQVTAYHEAATCHVGHLRFYEFPSLYSEYNTTDPSQFEGQPWLQQYPPRVVEVPAAPPDRRLADLAVGSLRLVKIDVEGAEYDVVRGLQNTLQRHQPWVVMEYLAGSRNNAAHRQATRWLSEQRYQPHALNELGVPVRIGDPDEHLAAMGTDSDNIAFARV